MAVVWHHRRRALAKITSEAARILGLEAGHVAVGERADVCIFDADESWQVDRTTLKSLGKNTPFIGMEMIGKVHYTLVGGQVVYPHG